MGSNLAWATQDLGERKLHRLQKSWSQQIFGCDVLLSNKLGEEHGEVGAAAAVAAEGLWQVATSASEKHIANDVAAAAAAFMVPRERLYARYGFKVQTLDKRDSLKEKQSSKRSC